MKKAYVKRIITGIVSLAVVSSIFVAVVDNVQATEATTNVVKYQSVTYDEFEKYFPEQKAPKCILTDETSGYLFAGWYKQDGTKAEAIASAKGIDETTTIVAKFVPARLTGVACQNGADVEVTDVTSTDLRIVSAVDSLNYSEVGFNVYGREKNEDGTYDEWLMYGYGAEREAKSSTVYSGLYVYKMENGEPVREETPKTTADIFGEDAEGFKFTTMNLSGIPKASYSTIVSIKPYWVTLDGTYVEGIGEFNRVQDGIDDIVNISVNLKHAPAIAAGMLNVTYPSNFEFLEAECGRVFEEMSFNADDTANRIVKCIGHVSGNENAKNPNDVYVNLRFRETTELQPGEAGFAITVPQEAFCNIEETIVTDVKAWDVRY